MLSTTRTRAALTALAVVAATLLASCETPPPPPPPVVAAPPAPPPITLSSSIVEKASAFRGYMRRAGAIGATFENPDQIQASLKVGVGYEPKQFLSGATAYAAVLALQDPTFVASVRTFAVDPAQRQQVINQLVADPAYAVGFKGSDTAAGRIIDTLNADGVKLYAAGKAVKQAAYDVQRSKWSSLPVLDRDGRLAYAKTMSATPGLADSADMAALQQASMGGAPLVYAPPVDPAAGPGALTASGPRSAPPPYKPLVIRGLAVAALAALGYAGDDKLPLIEAVMAEPASAMCLNMAKLNLYQCLAVAKPHYEDVFCLGQHIMIDTGMCVIKASGAQLPYEPPPPPKPTPAVTKKKPLVKKAPAKKKS
uniref:Lipoprotein n=1 Tax=Caulobacter sp. (strain K31) TaxID=366602 RepID=B0T8A2_CAUSK